MRSLRNKKDLDFSRLDRRDFLRTVVAAESAVACSGLFSGCAPRTPKAETFIGKAAGYADDLASLIRRGFRELKVSESEVRGKRILLKVNIVEPHRGLDHIVTNPAVAAAAAEAFLSMGAASIVVAEGAGHCRDTYRILEESGYDGILGDSRISFVDLNYDECHITANAGRETRLASLVLPAALKQADWLVSMPKLKTHHWVGVTLSMKNLFGALPGSFYGWPKNVIHTVGLKESILDINATLRPHFAIVDGIVGMEGDGPIMGAAKRAGVLVMGRNLPAADATCARLMGVDPYKIQYLAAATGRLGIIEDSRILQRGETWKSVRTDFRLMENVQAHQGLRLS